MHLDREIGAAIDWLEGLCTGARSTTGWGAPEPSSLQRRDFGDLPIASELDTGDPHHLRVGRPHLVEAARGILDPIEAAVPLRQAIGVAHQLPEGPNRRLDSERPAVMTYRCLLILS